MVWTPSANVTVSRDRPPSVRTTRGSATSRWSPTERPGTVTWKGVQYTRTILRTSRSRIVGPDHALLRSGGRMTLAPGACTRSHAIVHGLDPTVDPPAFLRDYLQCIRLLLTGELPAGVTEGRFKDALGVAKYRAHLNFYYGVVVEEALWLAVECEVLKERGVRGLHHGLGVHDLVWQRLYGGDRRVLGQALRLGWTGDRFTIIGVMPPGFEFPVGRLKPVEIWIPFLPSAQEYPRGDGSNRNYNAQVIGRLKPGVSRGQAYANMEQITGHFFAATDAALSVLPEMTDEAFSRPNPAEGRLKELFPTLGPVAAFMMVAHPMMHLGQVSAWRRMIGLGSVM